MGDEEPRAAFGFFVGLGLVHGLGEDRDTARVGVGGEVARVVVEGVDEREDGSVQHALR